MRVGSVNVGSMTGRSGEVVEMAARRRLDFCCLQETRWRGGSARMLGGEGSRYKFFWSGCEGGVAGVGVLVAERWVGSVIEVKRVSERIIAIRVTVGKSVVNIISVYMPQVGRSMQDKEDCYSLLAKTLAGMSGEKLFVF